MKTPDEIKKGLYHCTHDPDCKGCPYDYDCFMDEDSSAIANDTLEYIQQLENKIGELTEKVAQLDAAHRR